MTASRNVRSRRQQLYYKISDQISAHLFKRIKAAGPSASAFSTSTFFAYVIAGLIHLFILFIAIFGLELLISHSSDFASFVGIMLLLWVYKLRPRLSTMKGLGTLQREHFPTLYKLTDQIADTLKADRVDAIALSVDFNAYFARVDWPRKNVLTLGALLFEVLEPQERVALIAHELGHSVNGDVSRTFFVGSAVASLKRWRYFLVDQDGDMMSVMFTLLLLGLPWLLSKVLNVLANLLNLLMAHDSQRAEYLADGKSARIGSTKAATSVLHKLRMSDAIYTTVISYYDMGGKHGVFDAIRRKVAPVPSREIERVVRQEKWESSRLDATHPPISYRIQALDTWPFAEPAITLSSQDIATLETEFSHIRSELEIALREDFRRFRGL